MGLWGGSDTCTHHAHKRCSMRHACMVPWAMHAWVMHAWEARALELQACGGVCMHELRQRKACARMHMHREHARMRGEHACMGVCMHGEIGMHAQRVCMHGEVGEIACACTCWLLR